MSQGGILLLIMALAAHNQQARAEQASERAQSAEKACLTQALYYEARGEGERGQEAVAEVILDRVRSPLYPNSICGVVYEPHQFSFTEDGSMKHARDPDAWNAAERLATRIMRGGLRHSLTRGAMFYHAVDIQPEWSTEMVPTAQIGRHIFYRMPVREAAHTQIAHESPSRSS